jgi:hypothetical protein
MRKLLVLAGALAAVVPASSALAAGHGRHHKLAHCGDKGAAPASDHIRKRHIHCTDARVLIRSVEAHAQFCKPYRQMTIAPFRQCSVTPDLSTGPKTFRCRSKFVNNRYWHSRCTAPGRTVVKWRRDGNAITSRR